MKIKTFRARTLRDALGMVRAEFGPTAAVLHTREVNSGPIARLLRGRGVEVAATPDHSPLAEQAARSGAIAAPPARVNRVSAPLNELGQVVDDLSRTEPQSRDAIASAYARLIEADVAPDLARRLVQNAEATLTPEQQTDGEQFDRAIERAFASSIHGCGAIAVTPGQRRVVALVGPTGVGKTTTLAKLAANFRLREHVRVGVVTVDTYRVAAVEQLRTYADIIDLPMEVVATADEMRAALDKLSDVDLVLIDTAGRSPHDAERIEELRELLSAAAPDETHLVMSVTASRRGLRETADRFATVGPTALLLTKLDETVSMGHAAEPVAAVGLPVSYLTDGQNVPEDIRVAELPSLAARLLGKERA